MSSSAASPVKTSARLESEPGCLAIARAFGLSSPVLLAKFDPVSWLPRTCQASLLCQERWEPLLGSWPDSAMWDQTSVYELQSLERPILESECSSWPTARSTSGGGNRSAYEGRRPGIWPTPEQRDYRTPNKRSYQERSGTTKGEQLQNFVAHSRQVPAIPDGPTSSAKDPTSRRRLNPRFVEWLMGFPPGWTEL